MHLLARRTPDPAPDCVRHGGYPATLNLARLQLDSVEGDLRSMHVEPGYDRHLGLLYSSGSCQIRASLSR
jgi:hypothetical protein